MNFKRFFNTIKITIRVHKSSKKLNDLYLSN